MRHIKHGDIFDSEDTDVELEMSEPATEPDSEPSEPWARERNE